MFRVKARYNNKIYQVYAVQRIKGYREYQTRFLIYSDKGWSWIEAEFYEPVE